MGAFNQLNGAIFDAGAIEARLSAIDGKSIYNQRDGATLDLDSLARRLTALDGKIAVGQGGIEFDVDSFMRRLAAIEAAGTGFNPLSLFAAGEPGVWYDPSDFSSMFQDSAGTTPVTALGQPVGKVLDKSGRGNHAVQPTTTSRPTVQQDAGGFFYLQPDGVDDGLTAPFDLSATNKLLVVAGVRKASDASAAVVAELTVNAAATNGGFYLGAPDRASATYGLATRGTVSVASGITAANFAAPISNVVSCAFDNSAATAALQIMPRVNSVGSFTSDGPVTSNGNFANDTLYLFRRGGSTLAFGGRLYQFILRGALTADPTPVERYVGLKMGISL